MGYEMCGMRMGGRREQRLGPIRRFWLRQNDEQEQARARAGILWEKGWRVVQVASSSGSFALERRAQDDSVEQTTARTNNDVERATARANAGILRFAQNDNSFLVYSNS